MKILLADSSRAAADACAKLLMQAGHQVKTATTGRQTLALAAAFRPQALVLDMDLPDMTGYHLAEHLLAAEWSRSALLVAVTDCSQPEDRLRGWAAGFDHHFIKPITAAALEALLQWASRDLIPGNGCAIADVS